MRGWPYADVGVGVDVDVDDANANATPNEDEDEDTNHDEKKEAQHYNASDYSPHSATPTHGSQQPHKDDTPSH